MTMESKHAIVQFYGEAREFPFSSVFPSSPHTREAVCSQVGAGRHRGWGMARLAFRVCSQGGAVGEAYSILVLLHHYLVLFKKTLRGYLCHGMGVYLCEVIS